MSLFTKHYSWDISLVIVGPGAVFLLWLMDSYTIMRQILCAWMNGFTTVPQYQWSSGKTKTSYEYSVFTVDPLLQPLWHYIIIYQSEKRTKTGDPGVLVQKAMLGSEQQRKISLDMICNIALLTQQSHEPKDMKPLNWKKPMGQSKASCRFPH